MATSGGVTCGYRSTQGGTFPRQGNDESQVHTKHITSPSCGPVQNGFYVIIDDHTEDKTVVNSKAQFIAYWADLVTRLSSNDITRQRLIIDVLNEPDARGWGWDTMAVSACAP